MLKKLAGCKKNGSAFLEGCALAVVVLANVMESDVWIEDASVASIYMQLQARGFGIGQLLVSDPEPGNRGRGGFE